MASSHNPHDDAHDEDIDAEGEDAYLDEGDVLAEVDDNDAGDHPMEEEDEVGDLPGILLATPVP
jgi:hypothetical protein